MAIKKASLTDDTALVMLPIVALVPTATVKTAIRVMTATITTPAAHVIAGKNSISRSVNGGRRANECV